MDKLKATLQSKGKYYYCVISYKDETDNKWKLKWKTTKVLAKQGNKKKAKETFPKIMSDFEAELKKKARQEEIENSSYEQRIEENKNKSFITFINESLEEFKVRVELTTYINWKDITCRRIANYFGVYENLNKIVNEEIKRPRYFKKELRISEVTQFDIEDFYKWLYDCGLKGSTVAKYHVLLNLIFKRAIRLKIFTLETNPMKEILKPTIAPYTADYFTAKELNTLFEIVKGQKIEMPVILSAYYGLRRSEALRNKMVCDRF